MRWKNRQGSRNVEDRRRMSSRRMRGGGGAMGANLLFLVVRKFGFALWKLGFIDPNQFLEGGGSIGSSQPAQISPEEEELFQFASVVLAGTEAVWEKEFARQGLKYEAPVLVVYRGQTSTACGTGSAAMGPFYCPADRKIYIDLSFYRELERTFNAPGDFAQAYVIAHEVGHHVQTLLGTSDKVHAMRNHPDYNQYSVRLELQADFLAGVWAHNSREYLESGDIEEAMQAANRTRIGTRPIQKKAAGRSFSCLYARTSELTDAYGSSRGLEAVM
ncbi:UNVERIFIED_CONTAM: hypothetical protein GTU68_011605 [Idotea baltica]|nr:hypothetical protein [Idotea baltica]